MHDKPDNAGLEVKGGYFCVAFLAFFYSCFHSG